MDIRIGTSGFQYPEWKGTFYPSDLSKAKMLPYYAEHFPTTEINYSFRRIPSEKSLANWDALTPEGFLFSLKAPQKITHFAKLRDCGDQTAHFFRQISRLGPKLGCVLFQLPPSLHKDTVLLRDFLAALPKGIRAAFEFRHASWFEDDVFSALKEFSAALCIAENEELATPCVATADFGYLRLRREDYTKADIAQWADRVKALKWKDVVIYFKHEESGSGPKFAAVLQSLLPAPR